jgi:hypothetical protein
LSNGTSLTCSSSSLLTDLASNLSHLSGHFFRPGRADLTAVGDSVVWM